MAPKRAPKKAAPPPPPPAESSDETRSGSRSRSDESEDDEAIAESPVPAAATPVLKNAPADEEGDEAESADEEEDDAEEGEEEGEEHAAAAPKDQATPTQEKEDSYASGDEGESDDEEAAAALKPPAPAATAAAEETKKPGDSRRIWSTDDEVRILEALAAHQKQHGAFPQPDALVDVLAGKLDNPAYGSKELQSKVTSLRHRYLTLSKRGEAPSKEHDRRVLDLSKIVWDGDKATTPAAFGGAADDGHERKGFEEICELYPYLAEELKELETRYPGVCKRDFGKIDDEKARAMDEKIKKQRVVQIKVEMRGADLTKEVTKALADLVDG